MPASARIRISTTGNTTFAFAVTKRPQRAIGVFSRASSESSSRRRKGTFHRSILCPSFASTEISSEFAIATVVRTPSAEPMPSLVTKSRPKKARPVTEIATVRPAKSTARPAEDPASEAASTGDSPSCRSCLKRVTMNRE